MSSTEPDNFEQDHQQDQVTIEQAIAEVEKYLQAIKDRHQQIQTDQNKRSQLLERQKELKEQQKNNDHREPIKTELHHLKKELEELELHLESRLLSWSTFKEPFWQAVRFGGMGVILGWLLKSCS